MTTPEIITHYVAALSARYPEKSDAARALCEKYTTTIAAIHMSPAGCNPEVFAMSVIRQALLSSPAFTAEYRSILGGK